MKPWANRPETILVRTYRVPEGTPALPFPHKFLLPEWDGKEFEITPPEGNLVGFLPRRVRYDRGVAPAGWRPPTHWVGTEAQWAQGSIFGVDPELVWQGGFSAACKGACGEPAGQACATGCDQCPAVSALWCLDFPDFAGLTPTVLCKRSECLFDSTCAPAGDCPLGTSASWQVILDEPFAGLTDAYLAWDGGDNFTNCCKGSF